jgi:hypothetical protein
MPINYSQPGYQEMFANCGLTLLKAQLLERIVLFLWVSNECFENNETTGQDLTNRIDKNGDQFKQLVEKLKEKNIIPQELYADLEDARKKRNKFVHRFFVRRLEKSDLDRLAGDPDKISEEVRPIHDLFDNLLERVDSILDVKIKQFNIPREKIEHEAQQILEQDEASDET